MCRCISFTVAPRLPHFCYSSASSPSSPSSSPRPSWAARPTYQQANEKAGRASAAVWMCEEGLFVLNGSQADPGARFNYIQTRQLQSLKIHVKLRLFSEKRTMKSQKRNIIAISVKNQFFQIDFNQETKLPLSQDTNSKLAFGLVAGVHETFRRRGQSILNFM